MEETACLITRAQANVRNDRGVARHIANLAANCKKMADLTVIDAEPVGEDVVAYLEDLLCRARAGEFSSIAVAFVYRDGSTGSGNSSAPSLAALLGAVAGLQHKLAEDLVG